MVLNDVQKMFVQGMLSRRFVTEDEAFSLLNIVTGRNSRDKKDLEKIVDQVNKDLKKFHTEIKPQICEITNKNYYALISTLPSPDEAYDKCVHAYSTMERDFFRNIMEEIITSDERCIGRNSALNLTLAGGSSQSQNWGPHQYNLVLLKFIEDGWLTTFDDGGKVFLGPRAIAELEHLLLTVYKVDACKLCSRVVIVGFVCDVCSIMAHVQCLRIFGGRKAAKNNCMTCGSEMRRT